MELKLIIKKIKRKDVVNKWVRLTLKIYVLLIISTYEVFINLEK